MECFYLVCKDQYCPYSSSSHSSSQQSPAIERPQQRSRDCWRESASSVLPLGEAGSIKLSVASSSRTTSVRGVEYFFSIGLPNNDDLAFFILFP